jgi:cyclopropane-fatty-acyl-phospholipid synthase
VVPAGLERERPTRPHPDAEWRRRFAQPSLRKTLLKLRLVPRWLTSADFRAAFTSGVSANSLCFERELLDHFRLVFEKA